ncbi:1,4-dihydroxy-6-naphthoate synthase [Candidatus Magnetoovum chiemensis]|nr:1,4-dihydroxy-6-naphthoate synthase [Candidatus Magnetoovum chiemensis]
MTHLSLGFSPCPNDTYIFYAVDNKKVDIGDFIVQTYVEDVETLNHRALEINKKPSLDITKVSFYTYGFLRQSYTLLNSGAALGRGCGPLIVSKKARSIEDLKGATLAAPGRFTTAYLLFKLYEASISPLDLKIKFIPFNEIMPLVSNDKADAGIIIHESRFTYQNYGLTELIDLGRWWEDKTGLPIPLGGIIAKQSLGDKVIKTFDDILYRSINYAKNNYDEALPYIRQYCCELSDDVIKAHINLYVNNYTFDLDKRGKKAIDTLYNMADEYKLFDKIR